MTEALVPKLADPKSVLTGVGAGSPTIPRA